MVFTDVTAAAGLRRAVNVSGSPADKQFLLEEMGGGVAFFDYDNDGWLDIFLVNGTQPRPGGARRAVPPAICSTTTATARSPMSRPKAGLTHSGWGQACCVGDYDNDGFDDLFVTYWGQNVLYHNNGDGTFTDVSGTRRRRGVRNPLGRGLLLSRLRPRRPSRSVRRQLRELRSGARAATRATRPTAATTTSRSRADRSDSPAARTSSTATAATARSPTCRRSPASPVRAARRRWCS